MNKLLIQLKNNHGYALLYTFLVLVLVSVLGLSLVTISSNTLKTSVNEREDQSTFYIAEAGLIYYKNDLLKYVDEQFDLFIVEVEANKKVTNPKTSDDLNNKFKTYLISYMCKDDPPKPKSVEGEIRNNACDLRKFEPHFDSVTPNAQIKVDITENGSDIIFNIISTGIIGDKNRKIKQQVTVMWEIVTDNPGSTSKGSYLEFINTGLATVLFSNLDLNGSSKIVGDAILAPSISISPNLITGKIITMESIDQSAILPIFPDEKFAEFSKLPFPSDSVIYDGSNSTHLTKNGDFLGDSWISNNKEFMVSTDIKINNFIMGQNNTVYLNIGDSDKNIYIENLNMNNGHIKIIGTGKLNLYVNNSFTNGSSSSFNANGKSENLSIYYNGSSEIKFGGAQKINSTLFIKKADYTSTGSSGINGNIFSGGSNITISGDSNINQAIIAPYANVSMSGNSEIKGSLIANSLSGVGNIGVYYGNVSTSGNSTVKNIDIIELPAVEIND